MTQDKQERIENELNKIALFLKKSPQYKSQLNIIHELEKIAQNNNRDSSLETLDILENVAGEYFVPASSQASSSASSNLSEKDRKDIKRLIKNCERRLSQAAEKESRTTESVSGNTFDNIPDDVTHAILEINEEPSDVKKATSTMALLSKPFFTERQPVRLVTAFLSHVAKGNQTTAENMVIKTLARRDPEFLMKTADVTDYSGRTFKNITAYEYAWWAKDKHMLRMLESHMDNATKAFMTERINALEEHGLTYTQHGQTIIGSKHFDLTPLKTAYEEYIRIYTAWEQANYPDAGKAAVVTAWMDVGKAQRDLPVHYVNEYFRKDRSFHPRPDFNETNLPRELTFYNWVSGNSNERLFPLILTDSSGLGVDFAFIRAGGRGWGGGGGRRAGWEGAVDLAAVSHLDEVRTNDLMQSRKNLEPSAPTAGMSR